VRDRIARAWRWARGALHRERKPKATPPAALERSRRIALWVIAFLIAAASLVSFAESYRALYDWAAGHGLAGLWAVVWPIQVDVFIAVGELALFVGLAYAWSWRSRLGAWLVTLAGLVVSVAGNVGHVHSHLFAVRATAAVPPLAAAFALAVGLGVLKRVVEHKTDTSRAGVSVPGLRPLMGEYQIGQPVARKMQHAIVKYGSPAGTFPPVPAGVNGHEVTGG
jgi:hypothetical protein